MKDKWSWKTTDLRDYHATFPEQRQDKKLHLSQLLVSTPQMMTHKADTECQPCIDAKGTNTDDVTTYAIKKLCQLNINNSSFKVDSHIRYLLYQAFCIILQHAMYLCS